MPIYEYKCADCGHRLEAIQKVADAPLSDCPTCGKPGLKRLISAAGFQLKGTGWYVTDFRNNGRKQGAKPGGEEKKTGGEEKKTGGEEKSSADGESSSNDGKTKGGASGCAS